MEVSTAVLAEEIEIGLEDSAPSVAGLRARCAVILNKLPLTCRSLLAAARSDPRFEALLFYERTRLGVGLSGHFLEGLPAGLPLFAGQTGMVINDDGLRRLCLRDVLADRSRTLSNLEKQKNGNARFIQLAAENTLTDLPPGLPNRVHIFVSRTRAICQGLVRVKPDKEFSQCRNVECSRRFYIGKPSESKVPPPSESKTEDYWLAAAGEPAQTCEMRSFCCWACSQQWSAQLKEALPPNDDDDLVVDVGCKKEGRFRVSEALRRVRKRNEKVARVLRGFEKEGRRFPALSVKDIVIEKQRRIRMLNVDMGLLYAASVVADSVTLSRGKMLPATVEAWRECPLYYARAVRAVGKIYQKHASKTHVISNTLIKDSFLAELKSKAHKLF